MQFFKKYSPISINLLISYLSILIVPLMAIVLVYFAANNILINTQIEKSCASLHEAASSISKSLREASNIAVFISDSKELRDIAYSRSFFDVYKYASTLTEYRLINTNIDNVYIFFNDKSYIVKDKTVVPDEGRFYESIGELVSVDYSAFRTNITNRVYNGNIINIDADKSIFILQHFPYRSFESFSGTIAVKLNEKEIISTLDSTRLGNEGICLMIEDIQGKYRVQSYSGNIKGLEQIDTKILHEIVNSDSSDISINGKHYVISSIKDSAYGYIFVSLIPKSAILKATSYVRSIIVVLGIITFILSLLVCLALWRRRQDLLRRISAYEIADVYVRQPKAMSVWDSIANMLDSLSSMQDRIYKQEVFINMSFVRKIVLGIYDTEEALVHDMQSVSARLDGNGYVALSAEFKFPASLVINEGSNMLLIKKAFDTLAYPNLFCELSNGNAAIVVPLPKNFSMPSLKQELTKLIDNIYEQYHIQSYLGIGKEVRQRVDIAHSYEGAKRISDYLYYNDIRSVMSKEDAPAFKDAFFFPIETELQLIKTIKSGNVEDISDIFRMLHYENFEYRHLSPIMSNHFIDMLKACIIRNFKDDLGINPNEADDFNNIDTLNDIQTYVLNHIESINEHNRHSTSNTELKASIEQALENYYSDEQFNISVLANMLNVSESKLYAQIKQLFAMSFSDCLEQKRINKACELLQCLVPVKDVATQVGYNSDYSFRRAFKRIMGMPPSYYSDGFRK